MSSTTVAEGGRAAKPPRGRYAFAPSAHAERIAVVLRETKRIVRRAHGVLICETHHGFVCANAGVDLSHAPCAPSRGRGRAPTTRRGAGCTARAS